MVGASNNCSVSKAAPSSNATSFIRRAHIGFTPLVVLTKAIWLLYERPKISAPVLKINVPDLLQGGNHSCRLIVFTRMMSY
jgi:hypothetical protein